MAVSSTLAGALPPTPVAQPADLRAAFGAFATGVTIVTARDREGRPQGFTANSFASVSLDPPLLLVCVGRGSRCHPVLDACVDFSVHILGAGQEDLARRFASRMPDRFDALEWQDGPLGTPRLGGCLSVFDCRAVERIDAGDHMILMGRVVDCVLHAGAPLLFSRSAFAAIADSQTISSTRHMS